MGFGAKWTAQLSLARELFRQYCRALTALIEFFGRPGPLLRSCATADGRINMNSDALKE
jgi:hypothetical protein